MKKVLSLIAILAISIGFVFAATNGPAIKFKDADLTHNFGKVKMNDKAEYYFEFTNTGNKPLIIMDVHSSCGCTTPEFSKTPVAPGKKNKIKVGYKTDKLGPINRGITVTTNTGEYTLNIKGEVVSK